MSDEQQSIVEDLLGRLEMSGASADDKFVVKRGLENLKAQGVRNAYMTKIRGLVCTENLNSDVVMVKPAEDRV